MDQSGTLLPKPLLGHRLTGRGYQELPSSGLVDGREMYYSAALGLQLRSHGHGLGLKLVFRDPQTRKDVPVGEDMDRALESERSGRLAAEEVAKAATRTAEAERSARLAAEESAGAERIARGGGRGSGRKRAERPVSSGRAVGASRESTAAHSGQPNVGT